ncbi:N-acetylmuramoyl-L-alanine amidase [Hanstruepera neustonica]|uniref:N-acetylmuramoyl-L-alanine amidase n=1 Tax=Hanstruepera neustonica TaxID=1445657 RepID=A0A2K1DY80_9FLAO|nr:N-acetylmuramoyl-L-alanine amidase [Hanstruepera neustonica]PNQ72987.1 N-acetylmuramoyl-L-alanine amidase [Hanstruepera neustonica]
MNTIIKLRFLLLVILTMFYNVNNLNAQASSDKFVVVLDAGHGGHDPGKNSKYGYKEKDIALKIVLEVGKELEKNKNIKVIYTRKTDVFIELRERAAIANRANADLFVSIHCNAHHTEAYGTETYVLDVGNTNRNFEVAKAENEVIFLEEDYEKHYEGFDPSSPESMIGITLTQEEYTEQSILLASLIETNFSKKLKRKSRGVKQASLWVIHRTAMPSVLIETGFVTNKNEGSYLNSKKGQTEISNAIKDAILDYKHSLDMNVGGNVVPIETNNSIVSIDEPKQIYEDVIFKVQIAASSRKLEPKSYNFNGLDDISREDLGELYKYYYGNTSDYNEVKRLQDEAKAKGYKSCFIVAYKNSKQVSVADVLNSSAN